VNESEEPVNLSFAPPARSQYLAIRDRVASVGKSNEFRDVNVGIIRQLRDPAKAQSLGEILYKTQLPGGEVRVWSYHGIAVTYALYVQRNVAFIIRYAVHHKRWTEA